MQAFLLQACNGPYQEKSWRDNANPEVCKPFFLWDHHLSGSSCVYFWLLRCVFQKKKTFICDMFRLFGDMSWEVISNTFWKLISVCRDRSYFAMVPIFSQFKVICSMNKLVLWFDLVTQWDVLVFKAAVFSRDTDQIITAQPLLQGYLVLTCSVCLELFWDHFFAHFMSD